MSSQHESGVGVVFQIFFMGIRKIFNLKIILLALVVIGMIFGLVYTFKFSSSPINYVNDQFGFGFEYDASSKIEFEGKRSGAPYLFRLEFSSSLLDEKKKEGEIEFLVPDNMNFFSLEINSGNNCPFSASQAKNTTTKPVEVDLVKTNLIEADFDSVYKRSICVENDGKTFWFLNQYSNNSLDQTREKSQKLFDKIISSFRFAG